MQRRVEGKLMKERTSLQLCFATLRSHGVEKGLRHLVALRAWQGFPWDPLCGLAGKRESS